jgi:electron transport complex protein RnfG
MGNQTGNKEIFSLGLRLLMITAIAGLILGLAHKVTLEPIAKQQKIENDSAMQEVLPAAEAFNLKEVTLPDGSIIKEVNEGTRELCCRFFYKGFT